MRDISQPFLKMWFFGSQNSGSVLVTLWEFNIAMENCLFIDDFPIKTSIYKGFSMAMLNNEMVASISSTLMPIMETAFGGFHSHGGTPNSWMVNGKTH